MWLPADWDGGHALSLDAGTGPALETESRTSAVRQRVGLSKVTLTGRLLPRVASHVVVWLTVLVPVTVKLARGWRATWDDAYIALHAYQVFSAKSPLVGVYSSASQGSGHTFHDPGPLLFWLLVLPVHLDPGQGVLWGAAIWCGIALSVAIEAAWSVKGWVAAAVVALGVADLLWVEPVLFARSDWNPYFGLIFLFSSLVVAWVVAQGRFRWWPALVFLASVAAQCHLIYVINALTLIVLAPALGQVHRRWREHRGSLLTGIVVGILCWVAPLVQEVVDRPGNITLYFASKAHQPILGLGFGLRAVGDAAAIPPLWLSRFPTPDSLPHLAVFRSFVYSHSILYGALVIVLLGSEAWISWRKGHRQLASLATLTAASSVCMGASFSQIPKGGFLVLGYLFIYIWVVALAIWVCALWGLYLSAAALLSKAHLAHMNRRLPIAPRLTPLVGVVILGGALAAGLASLPGNPAVAVDVTAYTTAEHLTKSVERVVPRGPVRFELRPLSLSANTQGTLETAMVWQLVAGGWETGLPLSLYHDTGWSPPSTSWPTVIVTLRSNGKVTAQRDR